MKILLILFTLLCNLLLYSQNYSRVKISVSESELQQLRSLAIDLDHTHLYKNSFVIAELSNHDIQKLEIHNFSYEVLIEDLEVYYAERLNRSVLKSTGAFPCEENAATNYPTPINFALGSMGGYLTYDEFLENLDSMASKFPNLITVKTPISSFQTFEGRPIHFVRISDNPGIYEGEPQVLYTSIHHAREPASLSQTVYYMWYLLENYHSDLEIQYLVNETDMFFVPMINPDGYVYNETINPNGGGMWRKNRRDNGGGSFGVDLNRNYSYQWGTSGTSTTNTNDDTYCGTAPFSEPETQAIKWLCENNNFLFASNAHTYGNLLLFPFGYASNTPTVDNAYYEGIGSHMVQHNGYTSQISAALYPASGDSDDWMYGGDLGTKPKIYAFTPEIGPSGDGFWPQSNQIDKICKNNVFPNLRIAHYPHVYGAIEDLEDELWTEANDFINFELTRYGLTNGDFTVSITPVHGFTSIGGSKVFSGMQILDLAVDSISYQIDPALNDGEEIKYVINLDNGTYIHRDTIIKTWGIPSETFNDPGNDLVNWTSNDWGTTIEDYVSPSSSITDSPNLNYTGLRNTNIETTNSFDLTSSNSAFVAFWAKWAIENDYDYVQFEVSSDDGSTWIPICGNYTNLGTSNQELDEPLYDGIQSQWVEEYISLEDFLGEVIKFRFTFSSDIFVNYDGFYFDDFRIFKDANVSIEENVKLFSIFPNPTENNLMINVHNQYRYSYVILDVNGKKVQRSKTSLFGNQTINLDHLESGMYFICVKNEDLNLQETKKIIKN